MTELYQTATEQLLISGAIDHALGNVKPPIPPGSKVCVDADGAGNNMVFPKYLIGGVRDLILQSGSRLVDDKKNADLIAELRNGGQAINLLVGIPAIPVPIPLTGTVQTPELALFKHDKQTGIAKVALTVYSAKSGALAGRTGPVYGDSQYAHWTVLLLINRDSQDILPDPIPPSPQAP